MKKTTVLAVLTALAAFAATAEEDEQVFDRKLDFDRDITVPDGNLRVVDGAEITAVSHTFGATGERTHLTMTGGRLVATGDYGKLGMPCSDLPKFAFCLGESAGYVVADLGGGVIECTNGLFTVSRSAFTTCMVTGTVIRCRGFRLRAGRTSGYSTFILGPGGVLDITGEWGIRSWHDDTIQKNYEVGDEDFQYYFEMRGGKIRFTEEYPWTDHNRMTDSPCLIFAPGTDSEFEVAEGKTVCYAGQLQGEGTLHKTGKGTLILGSGFIHNEGTIVIEEGAMRTYGKDAKSLFWGGVVVKPGASLTLDVSNPKEVPDVINVCRTGVVEIAEGGHLFVCNDTTKTTVEVDMVKAAENGGCVETRSSYRVGVNMNLGMSNSTNWNGSSLAVLASDENVGAYPEAGSSWGYSRTLGNSSLPATDVVRIYSRSDLDSYIKFAYYAERCTFSKCPDPFTNGNMRVTKVYFDDRLGQTPHTGVMIATNALYHQETVEMPAPPNGRGWQLRISDVPYDEFDVYLIFATGRDGSPTTQYVPVNVMVTTRDGKQTSGWRKYTYDDSELVRRTVRTDNPDACWGGAEYCEATNMVEGVNYLKIHLTKSELEAIGINNVDDCTGCTVDITPCEVSRDVNGQWQKRAGLAGIQIVPTGEPTPELDVNEYTSFTADANIYALRYGEEFTLDFTATNENCAIGFVHSISNLTHVAPRVVVNGKEFPRLPGEDSRYRFAAANSDKIALDVKYLPWRDNQTNDLTLAQFAWTTNRWGGDVDLMTASNRALNAAAAIEGTDRDGDPYNFQEEWAMNADLTKNSDPMRLCIVGRAVSNDCLWLDVEYTRTENGVVLSNALGRALSGWTGVTNGVGNAAYLQLGLKGERDGRRVTIHSRGPDPSFEQTHRNVIAIPFAEITNRLFRAMMEGK